MNIIPLNIPNILTYSAFYKTKYKNKEKSVKKTNLKENEDSK